MSFIYEALKRAEDDNQQRVTVPVGSDAGKTVLRARSRWWVWALIGVLGANAVVVGAWMIVRRQPSAGNARAAAVDAPTPVPVIVPAAVVPAPAVPAPVISATKPPAPSVEPSRPVPTPSTRVVEKSRPVPTPSAPDPRAAVEPRSRVVVAPPPSERPLAPASAAADAPKIALQVLVYAETPAQRMVFIDGRRFAEGDAIDTETVLERINADGVVVNRRGQRFVISERRP